MTQTKVAVKVPVGDPVNAAIRSQALKDVLAVGGLAAAGGIGARGLLGLKYMFGRRKPQLGRSLGPTVISVPSPVYSNPNDELRAQKMAGATEHLLSGRSDLPWYLPGITLAGIGGLAGGYGLMDKLMDKKRKSDLAAEEAAARDEYRRALLDQYSPKSIPSADTMPNVPLPAKTVNPLPGAAKLSLKSAALLADLDALVKSAAPLPGEGVPLPRPTRTAPPGWKPLPGEAGTPAAPPVAPAPARPAAPPARPAPAPVVPPKPAAPPAAPPVARRPGPGPSPVGAGIGALAGGVLGRSVGLGIPRALMAAVPGAAVGAAAPGMARPVTQPIADRMKYGSVKKADMPGWAGKGLGIYGTLAGLLALGSGTAAYKFTKDRSTNKLMEDAIKQRERERWARRPPEIYAIPTPVRLTRGGDVTQSGKAPVLPGTEGMM